MQERIRRHANKVLGLGIEPYVHIDLGRPLSEADRAGIRVFGLPAAFAVVTLDNPLGHDAPEVHNDVAEETLEAHVQHLGLRYVPATGCSPDRSHCEGGFAVESPRRARAGGAVPAGCTVLV